MKNAIFTATFVTAIIGTTAQAEDRKPDNDITYSAALSSDYRYRGISQSRLQPALSAGADYVNNPAGLSVGTWASTIKWTNDAGGGGNIEADG